MPHSPPETICMHDLMCSQPSTCAFCERTIRFIATAVCGATQMHQPAPVQGATVDGVPSWLRISSTAWLIEVICFVHSSLPGSELLSLLFSAGVNKATAHEVKQTGWLRSLR
jgi:hypothetical protein